MILKCKICGGDLAYELGNHIATCEYCGSKQTLPQTASNDKIAGMYERANSYRIANEFDKAANIYEQLIIENNLDGEAYWNLALCNYGVVYVQDPKTCEYIPTCNRTHYLSILKDENYLKALECASPEQVAIYKKDASYIDEVQKGIVAIAKGEEPFDIFICYKETDENGDRTIDSTIANDIYFQLVEAGYTVFYAPITLEDKLGTEYEPYIFSALNSANIMLVIGTKPEYFNAVWVKNEWSRYLKLLNVDKGKKLIPCYRDMNAYDLPNEFAHLQALDMSKIGFMPDLLRGIQKLLDSDNIRKSCNKPSLTSKTKAKAVFSIRTLTIVAAVSLIVALLSIIALPRFIRNKNVEGPNSPNQSDVDIIDKPNNDVGLSETDENVGLSEPQNNHTTSGANVNTNSTESSSDSSTSEPNVNTNSTESSGDSSTSEPQTSANQSDSASSQPAVIDFEYAIDGNTVEITGYNGSSKQVNIPSTINGYVVTSIGADAFKNQRNISKVTMPDTVTTIGSYAFSGCRSLTSITIPSGVMSIGTWAFYDCQSLTSITIPSNITKIGEGTFRNCKSLTSITIPSSVITIEKFAFNYCSSLTSIVIPNSVTKIQEDAFKDCTSLTSIVIPPSVTSIESRAFNNCQALTTITIPSGVTSIKSDTFNSCSSLTSVIIPNSVTDIHLFAFYNCGSLTEVYFGNEQQKEKFSKQNIFKLDVELLVQK